MKSNRLKQIREALNKNQSEMAASLNFSSQGSYSMVEKGDVGISKKVRSVLLDKLNVNPEYLDHGTGTIFLKKEGVPVYKADFTAGDVLPFGDTSNHVVGYINLDGFKTCKAFVYVKGSSMYPEFCAGDLIGLEPILDFAIIEYGQPYAIETVNDQRMVKIIRRGKDNDNLILRSANKDFDDIDLPKLKLRRLFKVHGPIRDQWQ